MLPRLKTSFLSCSNKQNYITLQNHCQIKSACLFDCKMLVLKLLAEAEPTINNT